jgi:hypothetical protein
VVQRLQVQQNRYLWIYFAGLAAVPLLLDICLAGLASAGPAFDYPAAGSFQFWAIALIGIAPTLWMQLAKPFYVFSLPPLALNPLELTEDQRRCLQLLKSLQIKILSGITAGFALWMLRQLYERSPKITPLMTPTAGLVSAAVAFFLTCALLQISVSAGRSLFVGPNTLRRVVPVEVSAIASEFLILGLRVNRLLPSSVYAEPPSEILPSEKPPSKKTLESPIHSVSASTKFDNPSSKGDIFTDAIPKGAMSEDATSEDAISEDAISEDVNPKDSLSSLSKDIDLD